MPGRLHAKTAIVAAALLGGVVACATDPPGGGGIFGDRPVAPPDGDAASSDAGSEASSPRDGGAEAEASAPPADAGDDA